MELNMDCFRDLMLEFEEKLPAEGFIDKNEFESFDVFKKYGTDNVYYCLKQLDDVGFVDYNGSPGSDTSYYFLFISRITYAGHQFLENIKSKTVWEKTKKKIADTGVTASISIFTAVAEQIVKSSLGL